MDAFHTLAVDADGTVNSRPPSDHVDPSSPRVGGDDDNDNDNNDIVTSPFDSPSPTPLRWRRTRSLADYPSSLTTHSNPRHCFLVVENPECPSPRRLSAAPRRNYAISDLALVTEIYPQGRKGESKNDLCFLAEKVTSENSK